MEVVTRPPRLESIDEADPRPRVACGTGALACATCIDAGCPLFALRPNQPPVDVEGEGYEVGAPGAELGTSSENLGVESPSAREQLFNPDVEYVSATAKTVPAPTRENATQAESKPVQLETPKPEPSINPIKEAEPVVATSPVATTKPAIETIPEPKDTAKQSKPTEQLKSISAEPPVLKKVTVEAAIPQAQPVPAQPEAISPPDSTPKTIEAKPAPAPSAESKPPVTTAAPEIVRDHPQDIEPIIEKLKPTTRTPDKPTPAVATTPTIDVQAATAAEAARPDVDIPIAAPVPENVTTDEPPITFIETMPNASETIVLAVRDSEESPTETDADAMPEPLAIGAHTEATLPVVDLDVDEVAEHVPITDHIDHIDRAEDTTEPEIQPVIIEPIETRLTQSHTNEEIVYEPLEPETAAEDDEVEISSVTEEPVVESVESIKIDEVPPSPITAAEPTEPIEPHEFIDDEVASNETYEPPAPFELAEAETEEIESPEPLAQAPGLEIDLAQSDADGEIARDGPYTVEENGDPEQPDPPNGAIESIETILQRLLGQIAYVLAA